MKEICKECGHDQAAIDIRVDDQSREIQRLNDELDALNEAYKAKETFAGNLSDDNDRNFHQIEELTEHLSFYKAIIRKLVN